MTLIKHRPGAIAAVCTLLALGLIAPVLRILWMHSGGSRGSDKVWQLTLEFQFLSDQGGAVAYVALPADTSQARVLGQHFFYPQLRQARLKDKSGDLREAAFVAPRRGSYYLRADFQIYFDPNSNRPQKAGRTILSAAARELFLAEEPHVQVENRQLKTAFEKLFSNETDKNKLLERIADFCEKKIATAASAPGDAAGVLRKRKATTLGRARLMVAFCRIAKIPARLVSGFSLSEKPATDPHFWVEAFMDQGWVPFDPENGYRHELPSDFVAVRRGGSEILRIKGGTMLTQGYAITHIVNPPGFRGSDKRRLIDIVDLTRLPLSAQSSLIILLMLPLGALITTFARNVVGVRTIGTFTPTLLALATVYADWQTATIIFLIVIIIGIGGRALLPGLKLLKIPRLSIVFTLVTVSMALTVSALEYFHFTPAGHVVLLPLVVLTTIVDRTYSVSDQEGKRTALFRLGWTVVVALCCIGIFKWQGLSRSVLAYPELHFITLAALLLIGLYNSRKLTDFTFFHFLKEDHGKKSSKPVDDALKT